MPSCSRGSYRLDNSPNGKTETNDLKTLYLCGGINGLSDSAATDWREFTKKELANDYEFLDPMRRDYRGREDECVDEIVELDKVDIGNSQTILVNGTRPSWGTAMEVMYAFDREKEIISFVGSGAISPWLRYHTMVLPALEDAVSYLRYRA